MANIAPLLLHPTAALSQTLGHPVDSTPMFADMQRGNDLKGSESKVFKAETPVKDSLPAKSSRRRKPKVETPKVETPAHESFDNEAQAPVLRPMRRIQTESSDTQAIEQEPTLPDCSSVDVSTDSTTRQQCDPSDKPTTTEAPQQPVSADPDSSVDSDSSAPCDTLNWQHPSQQVHRRTSRHQLWNSFQALDLLHMDKDALMLQVLSTEEKLGITVLPDEFRSGRVKRFRYQVVPLLLGIKVR